MTTTDLTRHDAVTTISSLKDNANWLSVYLYYAEPWENFLTSALNPFVLELESRGWIEQFFFIRYWEYGPHIRLRLKSDSFILEEKVKPFLSEYFTGYMEHHPSLRKDPLWTQQLNEDQRWKENNTIAFVPYEPEVQRYGGSLGILIAEKQFDASSRAVLSILSESESWGYSQALGRAIQLHLGMANALRMDRSETHAFFNYIYANWRPRANAVFTKGQKEIGDNTAITTKAFAESFQKQKAFLVPMVMHIWDALQQKSEFENPWFHRWMTDMNAIYHLLCEARMDKKLIEHDRENISTNKPFTHYLQKHFYIFDSYVHMTNNRLGISNHDEGYLGYLIKECLPAE